MKAKMSWITLLLMLGVGISFFLLPSCDKLKEATTFKIKYNLPDSYFTIDTTSLLKTEMALFSKSFSAVNIDSIAGKNAGMVDHVSFYKLRFSIVTPESAKLDWLNSARVTLTPDGGLPIDIASSATINAADRSVDFKVNDVDITSAVKKPYVITLYGNLNGNIPSLPMEVLMESGLEITISPL